jgi:NB-ARC domain-containing protein/WD40 domain-containing protein
MESRDVTTDGVKPRDIVCVYSQADESFYSQLKKSLNLWERQRKMRWLEVLPGDEPAATWQNDVKRADLILLLLSPDFFPDELCYQTMHLALQERASRQALVVPILVRAVNWRLSGCKNLPVVPHNEQAVASWTSSDEAFASIGAELARLLPSWGLLVPTRPTLFRVPDLPESYVPRPEAFQEIKSTVLEKRTGQTTAITTALRGAGGFGKTTLAIALCHDPDIQTAFPDILWVELGEQPPRALDLLNRLLAFLERSHSEAITLQEARERWHAALRDRVCLLVIDDVWQAEALLPLLEGGPQCQRLITTRNDLLLPKDAVRVLVDAMNQREAVTLLCQDLPEEISQARYLPELEALVECLGCWPLLLTLARGMLTDLVVEYHQGTAEALTTLAETYQTRGVTAFRLDNVEERQRTVEACLKVSMQHLETFTHPHYHTTGRYQELAVFPEDTDIPLATLQVYWKRSAGLEPWETKDLCIRLHRLSLLLRCDLGAGTIRLHDVIRSYLQKAVGAALPALHAHLLDAYALKRWADISLDEPYLWDHLAGHLAAAGRLAELVATVKDLRYLAYKTLVCTAYAAEADLALAEQQVPTDVPLRLLRRNFSNMGHLLNRCSTYHDLAAVLSSRLVHQQELSDLCQAFKLDIPRPYLASWHPLPDLPDLALIRTLGGHTAAVHGCAISPTGDTIVSTSYDQTLKVWDARTGACLSTLYVNGSLHACAFHPDGEHIVATGDGGVYFLRWVR